jgi:hypothetical protein
MKTSLSPMKSLLFGAGALVATAGLASAQTAFTTPVGYHTETVSQGFNVIGVNLVDAPLVSSALTGAAGATLTDANVDFTGALADGSLYSIEFANGAWSTITEFTANSVTTADALTVDADASYVVRKVRTLADYFGADGAGFKEGDANTADIIWIPNGEAFDKAFYAAADPLFGIEAGWQLVGVNGDQANFPIPFTKGLIVQKQDAGDLDLTFTGHVKLTPTTVTADAPFTYLSRIYPAGATLGNSGLDAGVTEGDANTASNIWLPTGPGVYDKGFFAAADPLFGIEAGWQLVGVNGDQAAAPLTSGYIVQRNSEAFTVTLTPPAFYADL